MDRFRSGKARISRSHHSLRMSNSSRRPSPTPSPSTTPPSTPSPAPTPSPARSDGSSSPSPAPSPCPTPSDGKCDSSGSTTRTKKPSSSTRMELKPESNKRLNTGEPTPSVRMSNSLVSTSRTMKPSSSTGKEPKSESNKKFKIEDLMPIECIDQNFPRGNPFFPNDYELLELLRRKYLGILLPPNPIIDANVYEHHPQYTADLYDVVGETFGYFFTPHHGRGSQSLNWKATKERTPIIKNTDILLGFKTKMAYFERMKKTDWRIVEYYLKANTGGKIVLNQGAMALCMLYRKSMLKAFIQRETADKDVKEKEDVKEKSED